MEDILGYIIIFSLIIIFTLVYLSKREKEKTFLLTKKIYSIGTLDVLIKKSGKEFLFFIVRVKLTKKTDITHRDIRIEFQVDKSSDTKSLEIPSEIITTNEHNEFSIRFKPAFDLLKQYRNIHEPFRIVVLVNNNQKMKSGLIAFNKYWKVYVPDSGTYN